MARRPKRVTEIARDLSNENPHWSATQVLQALEQRGVPSDQMISLRTIRNIVKGKADEVKKSEIDRRFTFDQTTMEWMMAACRCTWDTWALMLDLWRLTKSVLISDDLTGSNVSGFGNEQSEVANQWWSPEGVDLVGFEAYAPRRPLVLRSTETLPDGYIPIELTRRHALWVWKVASATKGLTLLDQLVFAMQFATRDARPGASTYADLWGYLAHRPWSSHNAAWGYHIAKSCGAVPRLQVSSAGRLVGQVNDGFVTLTEVLSDLWFRFSDYEFAKEDPKTGEAPRPYQPLSAFYPDLLPSQTLYIELFGHEARWYDHVQFPSEDKEIDKRTLEVQRSCMEELASEPSSDSRFWRGAGQI